MKILTLFLLLVPCFCVAQTPTKQEIFKWQTQAKNITIYRDNYGVPHVYGNTDADAVFGLLYAQCEDDFTRVELNYIEKLGRLAEVNGSADIYEDLLIRLVIDSSDAKRDYATAPLWLKKILNAYADGINYFLYKNSQVKPLLLTKFQPWYPLLWTDGSIGAISTGGIDITELEKFYSGTYNAVSVTPFLEKPPTGSNGFAIAPKITANGNAMLYINPHVTFYFRPEVHMVSNEGLNAYGAVTWGQPFIYQGFNAHCGWMHTSSEADISDAYIEKITKTNGQLMYLYDGKLKKVTEKKVSIKYKTADGFATKSFTTLLTGHGPIVAMRNNQYISLKHNNRDTKGFMQSWLRTKTTSFADFKKTMDMGANPSNNTVYADAEGNIAYWHGNFLPKRNPKYDWQQPVDGTTSATEWKGYHTVAESVHLYNPVNGWLQNCNSTPFTVAGANSPKQNDYASYLAPDFENFRGLNAVRVLAEEKQYSLDKLIKAGYDTRLTAFEILIPALVKSFENSIAKADTNYQMLAEPIAVLKQWDYRSGENSVATTLAIEWGERVLSAINRTVAPGTTQDLVSKAKQFTITGTESEQLTPLVAAIKSLTERFGTWRMPWGDINRIQRISNNVVYTFDDSKPSYPVGFVSSAWGMLPSYSSRRFAGTSKRYGVNGNSFVAAVEFGKTIKAKSLLAGGESGDSASPHFFDQGLNYSKGIFKDVLFYKLDVLAKAVSSYKPGEPKKKL